MKPTCKGLGSTGFLCGGTTPCPYHQGSATSPVAASPAPSPPAKDDSPLPFDEEDMMLAGMGERDADLAEIRRLDALVISLAAERDAAYAKGRADGREVGRRKEREAIMMYVCRGLHSSNEDLALKIERGEHVKPPAPSPAREK